MSGAPADQYMSKERVDKLMDIMWQCVCTPWYPEFREKFASMPIDALAHWVNYQLGSTFPSGSVGSTYVKLGKENFTRGDLREAHTYMVESHDWYYCDLESKLEELVAELARDEPGFEIVSIIPTPHSNGGGAKYTILIRVPL